uniref:ATP synthase complex subunit 8 n=1 Tax=Athene superciliaris TaxID=1889278 RepID=A0A1L5JYB7_9STRI|nr:ATP synthase subunit 8 [Athene superciliaris]
MPQLNPNPWFSVMLIAWVTLSTMIQPKLLSFPLTTQPSRKTSTPTSTTPWTWPWT